jgi:hypothetical protein
MKRIEVKLIPRTSERKSEKKTNEKGRLYSRRGLWQRE